MSFTNFSEVNKNYAIQYSQFFSKNVTQTYDNKFLTSTSKHESTDWLKNKDTNELQSSYLTTKFSLVTTFKN